jgi:peptidoglycan/xylan/chitin deacetylase (PgdA/CDA1 family)
MVACCSLLLACSSNPPRSTPGDEGGSGGSDETGGSTGSGTGGKGTAMTGGRSGTGGSTGSGTGGASETGGSTGSTGGASGSTGGAPGTGGSTGTGGSEGTGGASGGGAYKVEGVATWRGDKTAAFSVIHDDLCDASVNGIFTIADPELMKRGLHGGFGAITETCDSQKAWGKVKTLVDHGHDIFSHSGTHHCLGDASACSGNGTPSSDYAKEIDATVAAIMKNVGVKAEFFIFPYDVCGAGAVARLKSTGFLGARCGDHGILPPDFTDAFKTTFDIWGPSYSKYVGKGPCAGVKADSDAQPSTLTQACRTYVLQTYIDDAIKAKGWTTREMHGFDPGDIADGGWQTVTTGDYHIYLDYLKMKSDAGDLWVEGPTRVIRYRFAREKCAMPTVQGSTLKFGAPSADCTKYATPVSYIVTTTDDPATLKTTQGGTVYPARKLGPSKFAVDADPTKGDAVISN